VTFTPPEWTPGDRLRAQRERLGLKISDIAQRAGVNQETVINAEKDRSTTERTMVKLAEALEAPVEWIRNG